MRFLESSAEFCLVGFTVGALSELLVSLSLGLCIVSTGSDGGVFRFLWTLLFFFDRELLSGIASHPNETVWGLSKRPDENGSYLGKGSSVALNVFNLT